MQTASRLQVTKLAPLALAAKLREYEERHHLGSQEFYDRFRAGGLGDSREFIQWAGLCDMAIRHGLLRSAPAT
jgi:hypothetical protein